MPWKEVSAMDQRREFVRLALLEGSNRRESAAASESAGKPGTNACADTRRATATSPIARAGR